MAKKALNPVEAERRKQKQREHRKTQQQKVKQRLEKISDQDVGRIHSKITALETLGSNRRLNHTEQRQLDALRRDLKLLEKTQGEHTTATVQPQPALKKQTDNFGKESVFYDPEFNPLGRAPEGYENVRVPLAEKMEYPTDATVADLPMPDGDPPRFYKIHDYSATKGAEEVRRDFVKESIQAGLVPVSLMKKPKPVIQEDPDSEEELASEEEEYRRKRRHVELEEVEDGDLQMSYRQDKVCRQ